METFTMQALTDSRFLFAAGQIVLINILLSGDNAILIALACRNLPAQQRKWGIIWGTAGAIVLRVILVMFALTLLTMPYLKIVGGVLLFWIGIKLLVSEDDGHGDVKGSEKLLAAVWTIILADLVMSVDNVLGIAGAAQGAGPAYQLPLIIFGLLVSVPIVIGGSQIVMRLMERFPVVITLGAALLGWLAAGMIATDTVVVRELAPGKLAVLMFEILGAIFVVVWGIWLARRKTRQGSASDAR